MGGLKRSIKQNIEQKVSSFRHELREKGRRFCSMLLCVSMITTNLSTGAISAYAQTDSDGTNLYLYEMESEALYEALQTAISEGNTLDKDLEFYGEWAEDYEELLEADGTLYELEPEILNEDKERDRKLGLRVFARVEGDIDLDEAYELEGTEEFVFLLANDTDEDQAAAIIVDEKVSEVITVVPGASIPVDIDAEKEAEAAADESPVEAPTEGVTGPAGGGSGGGGGAGGSAGGSTSGKKEDVKQAENVSDNTVNESGEESEEADSESESADADSQESGEAADSESGSTGEDASADSNSQTDGTTDETGSEAGSDASGDNTGNKENAGESNSGSGSETDTDESGSSEGGSSESGSNDSGSSDSGSSESGSTDSGSSESGSSDSGNSDSGSSSESGSSSDNGNSSSGGSSSSGSSDSGNSSSGGSSSSSESSSRGGSSSDNGSSSSGGSDSGSSSESGNSNSGSSESKTMSSISRHEVPLVAAGKATASNASAIEKFLRKASASDASPSDASYILDGTVYDAVRLKDAGAVAFITTADDLGLENDDREDLEYHFEASDGGIHAEVELEDGLDPDTIFVIKRKNTNADVSLEMAQEYLEETLDIPAEGRSYLILDMYFTDQDGNEITVDSEADIRLSFDDPLRIIGDDIQAMHISHITREVENVMEEAVMNHDGAVEELLLHATGFCTWVITSAQEDEDKETALKAYADELMDTYGLKLTITQSPAGGNTVKAGEPVTWYVTLTIPTAENYSVFSAYNKTLWNSYDDLEVTLTAPEGITIDSVAAAGYSIDIDENGDSVVVSLGDITANSQTVSFTVTGYVDADPAPATGTTYTLTEDDITYSTNITVLDRDNSNAEVATYNVTGTTSTDLSGFTLTSTTDDVWTLTKTQDSCSVNEDGDLVVTYTITLLMNGFTQLSQYAANGRVNFDSFSIVDTPTLMDEDGTKHTPTSITVVNNITNQETEGTTSVSITDYATAGDRGLTTTTAAGRALDSNVPVLTTYTVTAVYKDASLFASQFYDVETYTVDNTATLDYTLDYAEDTTPVTGSDTKTVTAEYSYAADPATIDLEKYINSIYGGGNYVTSTTLDKEYTGTVTFTILDKDGNAAEVYAKINGKYVAISNVITITRDSSGAALYVTLQDDEEDETTTANIFSVIANAIGNLLSSGSSSQEYNGLLYVNAGTYSIKETGNTIANTSFTEFTADSGTALTTEDNKTYSFKLTVGQAATLNAYNTEERGSISFNKSVTDYSGTPTTGTLEGAEFTLYSDEDCTKAVTTATSDSQGIVIFTKLAVGTYYIKETKALDGCLLDTETYTVEVKSNQTTTTFTDGSGTVYNKQNAATLTFEKYLLSTDAAGNVIQVRVDDTRLETVFNSGVVFELQQSSNGMNWTTIRSTEDETFKLERSSGTTVVSAATLEGLPVYTDSTMTTAYQYQIVEYLPGGYSLSTLFDDDITATVSGTTVTTASFTLVDGDTTVSLTNQTTGEVSVYKQYVLANTDGAETTAATDQTATTVYLLKQSGSGYEVVGSATTDASGNATISGVDILNANAAQEYYWAEAISNDAYDSYALEDGSTITVDGTEMYLLGEATYATAYESINSKTTLTNVLPYVRVMLNKRDSNTNDYVSGAGYTVYQVVDGEDIEYTDTLAKNTNGDVTNSTTLVLEAGYVYHVYETTIPTDYTGLTNADGSSEIGDYITIDLTAAIPDAESDDGVLQGTYAGAGNYGTAGQWTLYDKPYPTLKLSKEWVSVSSTDSNYRIPFTIYRATEKDGTYTYYKDYTSNTTVKLEPGFYYAFAETVQDGDVAPQYIDDDDVTGATLTEIAVSGSTSTVWAYVTDTVIEDDKTYTIENVTNYENSSNVTITKYAYDTSDGKSATLSGAVIGIYSDAACTTLVKQATTDANGKVTFSGLPVYDENGGKITYYVKEIDAPDGYFESETVLTVQLTAGEVTTVDIEGDDLYIYDEPELTVSVPVVWIDYDLKATTMPTYSLEGATVYLYKAIYDEDGNIDHYEYVDSATSVYDNIDGAYATFTGLRHNQDYVFVLGMSGVTDEDADNYPLYASVDYSEDYVGDSAPDTLTTEQLESYQSISYNNTEITERTDTTDDSLKNYLLHLEIDILKYCVTKDHGDVKIVYLEDGTQAWYVNGAMFYLYRQKLTDEQLAALANGEEVELTYDATDLERVSADTTSNGGTAALEDVYDDTYVYWLVEATTGTGHSWAYQRDEDGNILTDSKGNNLYESYYRVLLYPEVLAENNGSFSATNATDVQSFDPTEVSEFEVENTCGSGSHQYMISTIFMNKWKGYYDVYGEDTEDYSPFSGVTFQFSLSGTTNSFVISGAEEQTTTGEIAEQYDEDDTESPTQADNNAGQVSTRFKFAEILDQWYVAVAKDAGLNVTYVTDITTSEENLEYLANNANWSDWAGMLYVASSADISSTDAMTDLTANNGEAAMNILYAFADAYPTCTITSGENGNSAYVTCMENILCESGLTEDLDETSYLCTYYGYYSYYAHIVIKETDNGNYVDLTDTYDVYLQFRPTGGNGLANIKYFYLDDVDRDDYYYNSDPADVDTMGLDAALDNTEREQIVNMPVLNYSLTVTKYGYDLTSDTVNKTDDELDDYFEDYPQSLVPLESIFALQRYDSTTKTWKYYSYSAKAYVDSASDAQFTTDSTTGQFEATLPLGYYRLIEVSVANNKTNYEVILDGTNVTAKDNTTTKAVRYFRITSENSGKNTVNVYDPQSVDLYIEKYSLSGTQITSGMTFTLTAEDGTVYTIDSDNYDSTTKSYKLINLPAGAYTVSEPVSNSSVTDDYFEPFTITIDYSRSAKKGTAEQDSSVTEYDTYVSGVSVSINGQVECDVDGCEDSITGSVTESSAYATLTVHNPSTGSLTITKKDSSTGSTVTSGTATFELYYQAFEVDDDDAYVADTSTTPTYTAGDSTWTLAKTVTTSNGTVTASNLTPGWYAIVETSAPSGYELNSEVQVVAVIADMTADHTKQNGNGNVTVTVEDTKMVGLGVTKTFNLEDFDSDLRNESNNYSVAYGLYVYDTTSKTYVSAYDLGLTTTSSQVTVNVTNTSGSVTTNTGTWANLIQMEAQTVDGVYTVTVGSTTYTLDGYYYIKEEAVTNTSTDEDITSNWWVSKAEMSSGSSLTVSETAQDGGYYKVSGFTGNATGTVSFTNDLTYATVTIQKVDNANNALGGAEFTVYSDADCTIPVASGETSETTGIVTITVPLQTTDATTYYVKETVAPTGYTLSEETYEVTLKSGAKVSCTSDGNDFIVEDSNGVNVKLTKYDNIHDSVEDLDTLSGVTFTLLRSTDSGESWTVLRTYTTDSNGQINFDTLKNSEGTVYMLAETGYNETLYDGLESMWNTLTTYDEDGEATTSTETKMTTLETVTVNSVPYTGYQFTLEGIVAGSLYELYAYNQPRPAVTFVKEGDGTGTAVPTATLEIYKVDGNTYREGDTLTSDGVTAAKNSGTYVTTVTTKTVSGAAYSAATYNLSEGTYLVVETATSGGGYVINTEDADEVWYQIVEVPDDGITAMTADSFVNVTQSYDLTLDKSGTTELERDILASSAELEYTLDVNVTATGPINGLTVEDSGLIVTKVYDGVGSDATEVVVSGTDAEKYLEDGYTITSVSIPTDATYEYDSLVFNTGDKDSFTPSITAKVIFTYSDGTTDEQTAVLANVSGDYWTVTPRNSNLKVVSFTVTWYDETLKTYTGYELGSDFQVSESDNDIEVAMHIDQQNGGTTEYYAVAEIKNSATVTYDHTTWNEYGTGTDATETDEASHLTTVPNVTAPILSITKDVYNETKNGGSTAVIGDKLLYTITVTNSSDSLAMDAPVLLDLLPQGLVAVSADDEDSLTANVQITSSTNDSSTLKIENVYPTTSDGYTLLEIVTSGSLAAGETVTITLEAEVDSTVLNYLNSGSDLLNNVWVTSTTPGTVYHDNEAGSLFMGDTNSWAGNYSHATLAELMADMDLTGYGYVSDNASITYQATSAVNILKEVQGDQDVESDDWHHGDEGGTVTTNTDDGEEDDGYANFRLTVTNMNEKQDLVNIVLMDIVPKEDGASFNNNITKEWDLDFDSITSVYIGSVEITEDHYTLWYYTGAMDTSADVTAMQTAFDDNMTGDWVRADTYTGEMSNITAFAVVFDSTVTLGYEQRLQLTYKATVPQMSADDASAKAHLATYNDFRLLYQTKVRNTDTISADVMTLDSNYVYVLLETQPVGVGGMAWIDADGDGKQESEDVKPNTHVASTDSGTEENTATTYNKRKVNYADYSVVNTLLNSISIQLLTYNGSTVSAMATYSKLTGNSWRFLFDELTTANISRTTDTYNDEGIDWKALAGSSNATWYQLVATINGSSNIKYSLTNATTDVKSYDPEDMYDDVVEDVLNDSNFRTSTGASGTSTITTGTTTAYSEKFFLYSGEEWNLAEDLGLVVYRNLKITKQDVEKSIPEPGSTFAVYGPYADASSVTELSEDDLVETYKLGENETYHTFENLLYFQEYIIVETGANESYSLSDAMASGTNITTIEDGVTLGENTYPAWILNIPTSEEDQKDNESDPTAYNRVTTDNMTVTNAPTTTFTVTKAWSGDEEVSKVTRPDEIYVLLKRTTDSLEGFTYPYSDSQIKWEFVPYYSDDGEADNIISISPDNDGKWTYTWKGSSMLKYADGDKTTPYTYYAFEVKGSNNTEVMSSLSGKLSSTSYTVTTATDSNAQTITNTLDTGELQVTKLVTGLDKSEDCFSVTVSLMLGDSNLAGSYGYTISNLNPYREAESSSITGKFTDSKLTVNLYQDEILTISGLPVGTAYTVTENLGEDAYYIASYSNAVTVDGTTSSSGEISGKNGNATVTIKNIYNPSGTIDLPVEKVEDYHDSSNEEERSYQFSLYELATSSNVLTVATTSDATKIWENANSKTPLDELLITITGNDVSGTEKFTIPYEGYEAVGYYYYLVEEDIPSLTYRTYDTTKYVIEVHVTDSYEAGKGALVAAVTGFWKLTYSEDGQTVTDLEKVVNNEQKGYTSSFTNCYFAEGKLELTVTKKVWYNDKPYSLENRGMDVKFTFELVNDQGEVIDTQTITADELDDDGTKEEVPFDKLFYDQDDIGKVYYYTVREQAVTAPGYQENTELFIVKVEITDNGNNTLEVKPSYLLSGTSEEFEKEELEAKEFLDKEIVFNNFYSPEGDAKLIISKTLEGAELPADLFAASIRPIEIDKTTGEIIYGDETTIETKTFDEDGETFFTMDYDAEGDYWYEVREVIPWADIPATASNADDGTYTYDESVYYVKITVTDQHNGTLAATTVTVTETSPTGKSVEVETVENGKTFKSITFENKYTGSKVDVPVTKVWKDYENRYKTRPESIIVTLYRDGEKTDQTLELNDGNDWTDVFTDLDEYNYGDKIVYTVEESSIEGYAGVITGDTAEGYEITNTWTKEAPGIQIVKTASTREDGTAYKRGEVITYTIVVTNTGNVVLTDVVVTDELTGNSGDNAWTVDSLEPGESVTFTATYTVVSADVTAKNVHNEASVTAKDPEGKDVEDDDSTDTPTRSSSGSGGGSGSSGSGSSSSTSSTSSGGPGVGTGLAEDEMISLLPIDYGELAKTGEGRETEAWMFTSLLSGLMLILTAWLRRKKEEDE